MTAFFLEAAGTNGYIATPFDLMSTETNLNAMTSGSAITSTVGGTSGVFTQANFANAVWAEIILTAGGAFTPAVGGYMSGWFLRSKDGGSNFESLLSTPSTTVPALPRPPDFTIAMDNAAFAAGSLKWANNPVKLPFGSFKVTLQNFTGVTVNITHITCAPIAIQY